MIKLICICKCLPNIKKIDRKVILDSVSTRAVRFSEWGVRSGRSDHPPLEPPAALLSFVSLTLRHRTAATLEDHTPTKQRGTGSLLQLSKPDRSKSGNRTSTRSAHGRTFGSSRRTCFAAASISGLGPPPRIFPL